MSSDEDAFIYINVIFYSFSALTQIWTFKPKNIHIFPAPYQALLEIFYII